MDLKWMISLIFAFLVLEVCVGTNTETSKQGTTYFLCNEAFVDVYKTVCRLKANQYKETQGKLTSGI